MVESNNINYMKIHFTWINWNLENRKLIREKIVQATIDERVKIAKHAGLDNEFLKRRMKDVVFKNIIFKQSKIFLILDIIIVPMILTMKIISTKLQFEFQNISKVKN